MADRGRLIVFGREIEDGRALGAKSGALIERRKVGGRPVAGAVFGETDGVVEDDVSGQVLVLRAEAVDDPGAEGGMAHEELAGVDLVERVVVIGVVGPEGMDEAEFVDDFGRVRERGGHPVT